MSNTEQNRRIMRRFRINEISAVDRPAQQPALATILKREDGNGPDEIDAASEGIEKTDTVDLLTSSEAGHQHGIRIHMHEGEGMYTYVHYAAGEEGEAHDHQIVMNTDGSFTMSENHGHTHEIDREAMQQLLMNRMVNKDDGTNADPVEDTATIASDDAGDVHKGENEVSTENQALEARLQRAEAIVALSKSDREYFDGLDEAGQDAFLEKSAEDQAAEITKAAEAQAVVYTDRKGRTYTKADGERMIELAKEADASEVAKAEADAEAADTALTKRAEDMAFLPGDVESRKALLKSIDAIEDEGTRTQALSALKSTNTANKSATETVGAVAREDVTKSTEVGGEGGNIAKADAEARLDELSKAHAKEHNVSYAKAYDAVLATPEGGQLYAASV